MPRLPTTTSAATIFISFINQFSYYQYCGNLYQVDAWGYGSSPNTVAVVESTFEIHWPAC